MVNEAERFAEEDKKRRELAEARNQADSLAYSAEKSLKDLGDKVDAAKAEEIRKAVEELRSASAGDDLDKIKQATEKMNGYMHELSAKLYEQAKAQQGGAGDAAAGGGAGGGSTADEGAENVVDADYDVKDDDK